MFSALLDGADSENAQDIVRRATSVMQADWAAAPQFALIQRDATTLKGITSSKTQQVFMIAGSDYYMPIAIDDVPLSAQQRKLELEKLKQEVDRRTGETAAEAERRSERYRKLRQQNEILLSEFTQAFDFTLAGDETIGRHAAYVLDARPRPGYRPPNRTAKVLTGMQGRLWVDKKSFHWIKAEAEALKPVSVFGIFAKVLPGTKMQLEMTPVTGSVWQVSRLQIDLRLAVLWRKSSKTTLTTFSHYEAADAALARALAGSPDAATSTLAPGNRTAAGERTWPASRPVN